MKTVKLSLLIILILGCLNTPNSSGQTTAFQLWQYTYNTSSNIKNLAFDNNETIVVYLSSETFIAFDSTGYSFTNLGATTGPYGNDIVTDDQFGAYRANINTSNYQILAYKKVNGSTAEGWQTLIDHPLSIAESANDNPVDLAINLAHDVYLFGSYTTCRHPPAGDYHNYITVNLQNTDGSESWRDITDFDETISDLILDLSSNVYITGSNGPKKYNINGAEQCRCDTTPGTKLFVHTDGSFFMSHSRRVKDWYYYTPNGSTEYEWDDHNHRDVWLIKYNAFCEEQWRTHCEQTDYWNYYNREPNDHTEQIYQVSNYVYVAIGNDQQHEEASFLYQYDLDGNLQWACNIACVSMVQHDPDFVYAVSYSKLYKIDATNGNIIWEHDIGNYPQPDEGVQVKVWLDSDNEIYVCGKTHFGITTTKYTQRPDADGDDIENDLDNCPLTPNSQQEDDDQDGKGNVCDNCPNDANEEQFDNDDDGWGDVCDNCPDDPNPENPQADSDNDGHGDACDNCRNWSNPSQNDTDGDKIGNECDNCPNQSNPHQENNDRDAMGDICDPDDDNDGILDGIDNCPFVANTQQYDTDSDGIGDACNEHIDDDGDNWANSLDNCELPNEDQADENTNGIGDACELELSVNRIELIQVVQDQDNSVPLVRGKETWIRVHLNPTLDSIGPVWAELHLTSNGTDLQPTYYDHTRSPITVIDTSNIITPAERYPSLANLNHTLNFRLPKNWYWDNNSVKAKIIIHNDDMRSYINNNYPDAYLIHLHFWDIPPLNINYVKLTLLHHTIVGGLLCTTPTLTDYYRSARWVKKIYPISRMQVRSLPMVFNHDPTVLPNLNGALLIHNLNILDLFTTEPLPFMIYFAQVCSEVSPCLGNGGLLACDNAGMGVGGHAWSIYSGASVRSSHMNHELFHAITNDISHTSPACGTYGPHYSDYPEFATGRLETGTVGFDVADSNIYTRYAHHNHHGDYVGGHYDLMNYCSPQWISAYSYKKLFWTMMQFQKSKAFEPPLLIGNQFEYLLVSGVIVSDTLLQELKIQQNTTNIQTKGVPSGPYTIRFFDKENSLLYETDFGINELGHDIDVSTFLLTLPYYEATDSIEVVFDKKILKTLKVSPHKPSVQVFKPNSDISISNSYDILWAGSDPDNDPLIYDVYYSPDNGESWMVIALGLTEQSYTWNTSQYPGTNQGLIRVVVTDSVNTTYDDCDVTFSIPKKLPEVVIQQPAAGTNYFANSQYLFEGTAYDEEDGQLDDSLYFWTSSIDGDIGHGSAISPINLSAGSHNITLSVTDSDGNTSTTSINITISDITDTDGDGIGDDVDPNPSCSEPSPQPPSETCIPFFKRDSVNIIKNGSFSICDLDYWDTYTANWEGVEVISEIIDGTCIITPTVIASSPLYWHIQLQQGFTTEQIGMLEIGETYRLSFHAVADTNYRPCHVYFGQAESPNTPLLNEEVALVKEMQKFSFEFEVTQVFDKMKLAFGIGTSLYSATFDRISLVRVPEDSDNDGIEDEDDNCPYTANTNQHDTDGDGIGNACDNCPNTINTYQTDTDNDNVGDLCDNCPNHSNAGQADSDHNGVGNACEPVITNDADDDGIEDYADNCPLTTNQDQNDRDADNVGDACDNCPDTQNSNQADANSDGIGDVCEPDLIENSVGIPELVIFPNPAQQYITVKMLNGINIKEITLHEITGRKLVRKTNINTIQHTLLTNGLKSGIYYLIITTGNNQFIQKITID